MAIKGRSLRKGFIAMKRGNEAEVARGRVLDYFKDSQILKRSSNEGVKYIFPRIVTGIQFLRNGECISLKV